MIPIKNGKSEFKYKPRFPMKLTCDVCEAEMEVDYSDMEFMFRGVEIRKCFYCNCLIQMGNDFDKTNAEFRDDYRKHLLGQREWTITREDNVPYSSLESMWVKYNKISE